MEVEMEVVPEITNQLKIEINPPGEDNTIIDYQSQNKGLPCHFLYLLMGIDKLHDFGEHFTKIYDLIYKYYFLYNNNNLLNISEQKIIGQKRIGPEDIVEQNLKNKVNALHKLIDFLSYKTNLPIRDAPILNFIIKDNNQEIMNINTRAPYTMASVKISDLNTKVKIDDYISKIPAERDVLLYFTGRKSHFKNTIKDENTNIDENILSQILKIPNDGEYVSKDAFPMSNDIINSIFKRGNRDFESYTSQLMDPATQMKDIVPVEKQIKTLFCILTNNKKLFLNASLNDGKITLSFTIDNNTGNDLSFTIEQNTPTPSIQDVVIYLYYIEANINKKLKALHANYGAKIMNLFKTNKKKQNEIANNLKMNYFDKLIDAVPNSANLQLEDRQLIAISSKTIGDQTYLWDSLIHDSSSPPEMRTAQGSFVATVDSFLFDQIVHGKNANAIFASKLNGGAIRDAVLGSNYQMIIYLKPLNPTAAADIREQQNVISQKITKEYGELLDEFKTNLPEQGVDAIITNFKTKRIQIVNMLVDMFENINRHDPSGRIPRIPKSYQLTLTISQNDGSESKMEYANESKEEVSIVEEGRPTIDLTPIDISNYYYAACYLLHFIIQCEISLLKVKNFELETINDGHDYTIQILQNKLNSLKGINNTYDDALSYYDNTLESIININELYKYLNNNEVSSKDVTPDFEKVRNSLNQNKSRLEYYLNQKLPNTIGFSKCFFAIKDHVKKFFQDFKTITFKGNSPSTIEGVQQLGGNNIPQEAFEEKIIEAFPPENCYNRSNTDDIFNDCDIEPMDYYELFYLLKQLYYETPTDETIVNFEKSSDDFYKYLYFFIKNKLHGFHDFIQNNILYLGLNLEITKRDLKIKREKIKEIKEKSIKGIQNPNSQRRRVLSRTEKLKELELKEKLKEKLKHNKTKRLEKILAGPLGGGKKTKRKRKRKYKKIKKTKRKTKK